MRRILIGLIVMCAFGVAGRAAHAAAEEPTMYVIQKGDTLWGLSERFIRDPYYWPNMWAGNAEDITNPHFIFPGQKLRIFSDRIEVVTDTPGTVARPAVPGEKKGEEPVPEKVYTTSGGEGFLMETSLKPAGYIVSTYQNRQMVGEDDIVYVDVGKTHGVKVGDRFSIFRKMDAISHPISNLILGNKVIPLGTLQISETEEKASKAIITNSYMEISPGAFIAPYRDKKREIPLRPAERDFAGYIVETKSGNATLAAGDIAYLDLGQAHGIELGVMLYVVRDVVPDRKFFAAPIGKFPKDVIGALVVVEMGRNTSTALVVKSIDTVYRGDRVEAKRVR